MNNLKDISKVVAIAVEGGMCDVVAQLEVLNENVEHLIEVLVNRDGKPPTAAPKPAPVKAEVGEAASQFGPPFVSGQAIAAYFQDDEWYEGTIITVAEDGEACDIRVEYPDGSGAETIEDIDVDFLADVNDEDRIVLIETRKLGDSEGDDEAEAAEDDDEAFEEAFDLAREAAAGAPSKSEPAEEPSPEDDADARAKAKAANRKRLLRRIPYTADALAKLKRPDLVALAAAINAVVGRKVIKQVTAPGPKLIKSILAHQGKTKK